MDEPWRSEKMKLAALAVGQRHWISEKMACEWHVNGMWMVCEWFHQIFFLMFFDVFCVFAVEAPGIQGHSGTFRDICRVQPLASSSHRADLCRSSMVLRLSWNLGDVVWWEWDLETRQQLTLLRQREWRRRHGRHDWCMDLLSCDQFPPMIPAYISYMTVTWRLHDVTCSYIMLHPSDQWWATTINCISRILNPS